MIVVAISSAIDCSAFATICSVTGSEVTASEDAASDTATVACASAICSLPLEDKRRRLEVPPDSPASRDDDRGVVLVDEQRPCLGVGPDRRARAHRHLGRL